MELTEFERWLFAAVLANPRRRVVGYRHAERRRTVNPPGSAAPEVRAARAKQKAADKRKKATRKAGRR